MMRDLNKIVTIWVTDDLWALLWKVSGDRGEDVSAFIRRAVLSEFARLSFLPEEQKKALGIPMKPEKVVT